MVFSSKLSALRTRQSSAFAIPQLHYTIDRPFQWKWLSYAIYSFMLLVLAILVPVNYALQGYETITTNKQDPNTTSVHWYHKFTGDPTPGSQCDAHLFNLGDTFQTTIGTLSYTIQSIQYNSSDGFNVFGGTTIPYKGLSTDFCDIISVSVQAGPAEGSVVGRASIQCIHKDFTVGATTSIDYNDIATEVLSPSNPLLYLAAAAEDLLVQPLGTNDQNNSATVISEGVTLTQQENTFPLCPMFLVKNETDINGGAIALNATAHGMTSENFCTPQDYDQPIFDSTSIGTLVSATADNAFLHDAVASYMQVLASLVRYDLGSQLPNNFLVNTSGVLAQNQTFLPVAPKTQILMGSMEGADNLTEVIQQAMQQGRLPLAQPFNASAPNQVPSTTLSTSYECHLTMPKGAGAAAISVIVATLSIGGSIWGLAMLIATFFAKGNRPDANYCEYHSVEQGLSKPLNDSEEHLELRDRSDFP